MLSFTILQTFSLVSRIIYIIINNKKQSLCFGFAPNIALNLNGRVF